MVSAPVFLHHVFGDLSRCQKARPGKALSQQQRYKPCVQISNGEVFFIVIRNSGVILRFGGHQPDLNPLKGTNDGQLAKGYRKTCDSLPDDLIGARQKVFIKCLHGDPKGPTIGLLNAYPYQIDAEPIVERTPTLTLKH